MGWLGPWQIPESANLGSGAMLVCLPHLQEAGGTWKWFSVIEA